MNWEISAIPQPIAIHNAQLTSNVIPAAISKVPIYSVIFESRRPPKISAANLGLFRTIR